MKFIKVLTLAICTFAGIQAVSAQACRNFHKSECYPSDNKFFSYNGQSKSGLFAKGQSSELYVIVYKGQDYRISICTEEELGDKMEWKIKDGKTGEVLYNNADDEYAQEFEFSCDVTRKLILEVSVPDGETKNKKLKAADMACLGVLIEHMPTPKSGF